MTAHPSHRGAARVRRLLSAAALILGGCVIPIGPEFEDPAEACAPYVVRSNPPVGDLLIIPAGTSRAVEVQLADPNLHDTLEVRWLLDYPPYDDTASRQLLHVSQPSTGRLEREPVRIAPDCIAHAISPATTMHRLLLSVSDRPFLPLDTAPPEARLDSVQAGAHLLRAVWLVDMDCSQ